VYVIGIDIGTTTIACIAVDSASGAVLKSVSEVNTSALAGTKGDEALYDPDVIIKLVQECLQNVILHSQLCTGIGISGQMHGIVYIGKDGMHKGPLISWQDRRGERLDQLGKRYVSQITERSGHVVHSGYGIVSHFVNSQLKQVPSKNIALCTIGDYVAMRLTGAKAPVMNTTQAASIGCFDVSKHLFDEPALQRLGLVTSILPQLVPAHHEVGRESSGIPVYSCIGDTQASFLGSVTSLEQSIQVNIGTGAQVSAYNPQFITIDGLDTRPFLDNGYLLVGASLSGGKSYALLEQFFRETCRIFSKSVQDKELYEIMNKVALTSPTSESPVVHTQFYGSRGEDKQTGSIERITNNNWTPAHLIHGFLGGITDELVRLYRAMPQDLRNRFQEWNMAGNGIRLNLALQLQIEQALGLPLQQTVCLEEAAYGAAMHGAVSSGLFDGYEAVIRAWKQ
jgi:sedoheptulokinase